MADSDIHRCARLLEMMAQHEGVSASQLEEALGSSAGTVERLFSGRTELTLRQILAILESLQVPPAHFFRIAFPEEGEETEAGETGEASEAEIAARLLDLLDHVSPQQTPPLQEEEEVSSEELDRRIAEALRRLGMS
jgi:transcriptional regulator with XRE-family HTH domain